MGFFIGALCIMSALYAIASAIEKLAASEAAAEKYIREWNHLQTEIRDKQKEIERNPGISFYQEQLEYAHYRANLAMTSARTLAGIGKEQ